MGQWILRGLTLAVAVLVFAAAGCGGEDDPFVGTWRAEGADAQDDALVIAKSDDGYTATTVIAGFTEADGVTPRTITVELTREGDTLTSVAAETMGLTLELTYLPESGRLSSSSGGGLGFSVTTQEYVKTSASTAIPGGE